MTLYATVEETEQYLRSTVTADLAEIEVALTVGCQAIDLATVRTFGVPDDETTKVYAPISGDLVKVDDIANTTNLVIVDNGSTLSASDYQLETWPGRANQMSQTGIMYPFAYIRRLSGSWHVACNGEATLSVTAQHGWPAVPDSIKLASKLAAKDYLDMRDTRFGLVQVGDFARRIMENSTIGGLLQPFRSGDSWGIA
jgi:hypothetical protein